ncbi:restriction endonuclease subunit S [Marinobacter daepoensis]|uniref:restriction endonuclease subunit S n=1 Tax=Marinobacter daepoensis TaxID=262077 RepID=UPI0005608A56|nr:restriction endonuclease subunit S [Marinobacter daepoensis]
MSKYVPYVDYQASNVEWIGETPKHWWKSKLKFEAHINMGQSPSSDDCNQDGIGLPFLQGNAEFGRLYPIPKQYCAVAKKTSEKGEILFSVRAPVGAINLADQAYGIGRGLCSISPSGLTKDFLWWAAIVFKTELVSVSTGSTFEAVSAEQVENLLLFRPPIDEQNAIAAFLNHETAKIDTLIEKQQQLIKLLKEKRQAVISHAVTKGLNPDAPIKDSGVEWLGEVPEHWSVVPLRHITPEVTVGIVVTPAKYYVDNGIPCFRSLNVKENSIEERDFVYISKASNSDLMKSQVFQGDILVVRSGQPGKAAVVLAKHDSYNCIDLIIIRKSKKIISDFLCYQINSDVCKKQISSGSGGAIQQHFNVELAKGLYVTFPPLEEQMEISKYIMKQIQAFDSLVKKAEMSIDLMKERRSALISAAVTGKIDVRNWKPQPSADKQQKTMTESATTAPATH